MVCRYSIDAVSMFIDGQPLRWNGKDDDDIHLFFRWISIILTSNGYWSAFMVQLILGSQMISADKSHIISIYIVSCWLNAVKPS